MKDVANPFHFELNWYPEYSYCTIPEEIPEEEIKDRWRKLSERVTPEEKGIPEFRNIRLSDIFVERAKRAFYANAYPEKPIHHINFENVSVEAEESGKLSYASDWVMKNVQLKSATGKPIELIKCSNIQQPEIITTVDNSVQEEETEQSIEQQIQKLTLYSEVGIIPVNLTSKTVIENMDTTQFSQEMEVLILHNQEDSLKYYEPLGDGFYYTPVVISIKNKGAIIEVKGQKQHDYTLILRRDSKPANIYGADHWEYDSVKKQAIIEKKAAGFSLQIDG